MRPLLLIDLDHTLLNTRLLFQRFESRKKIKSYVYQTKSLQEFLFPDAAEFFYTASKFLDLGLFSEGEIDFQRQKIEKLNLNKLIPPHHQFVFPPYKKIKALPQIVNKFHPIALLDDKPEYLLKASSLHLKTIWVNRKRFSFDPRFDFCLDSLSSHVTTKLIQQLLHPLKQAHRLHLVGIKGVGMTATALCLADSGKKITGSDSEVAQITDPILKQTHIPVSSFSPSNITKNTDLVIYSGAYSSRTHPELITASKNHLYRLPQAEALAEIMKSQLSICVCGVGGKTTTTSMLIHLFHTHKLKPSWFVGTSQVLPDLPPGRFDQGKYFIVEADEYAIAPPQDLRPKFSLYDPFIIICTNISYDHPDIYQSFTHTKATFLNFFSCLSSSGLLILNRHIPGINSLIKKLPTHVHVQTFGTHPLSDWRILPLDSTNHHFQISHQKHLYPLNLKTPGLVNAFNATSALIAANHCGINSQKALNTFSTFLGCKRRQELVDDRDGVLYYDDYAHHPAEILKILGDFKTTFPQKRLFVIFQAHTYSRTQALLSDFATCFTSADLLIVTPIFSSAREKNTGSITGSKLAKIISKNHPRVKYLSSFPSIATYVKRQIQPGDIVLTLGAGDIYKLHQLL